LKTRCESVNVDAEIQYIAGDVNRLVDSIVAPIFQQDAAVIPGKWGSLNLAFFDPEGLELEWATIASLARVPRMDLIIHYSQSGLTRNLDNCFDLDEETVVDRFFGDTIWRQIYCENRERGASHGAIHRALIDHYKAKLGALGYVKVVDPDFTSEPLIRNTMRNAPLYRLLFASKHDLGNKFWSEVTKKNVYGQQRLF
jgi:three-Cys-motif partner protein